MEQGVRQCLTVALNSINTRGAPSASKALLAALHGLPDHPEKQNCQKTLLPRCLCPFQAIPECADQPHSIPPRCPHCSCDSLFFSTLLKKKTVSKHPTVPRQLAFPPGLLRDSLSEPIHHPLYAREKGCSGASLRYSNADLQIGRVIHHPGQAGCNSEIKSGATGQESRPSADDLFLPAFC